MKRAILIHGCLGLTLTHILFGGEPESAWSWMLRVQEERDAPLVKYCGEQFPAMKRALDAHLWQQAAWLREAAASLQDKVAARPDLARQPDPKIMASIQELQDLALQVAMAQDAGKVCTDLERRFLQRTFEAVRNEMEAALEQIPVSNDRKGSSP